MSLTDKLVKDYIQSEWMNRRRPLIEPQAREELFSGARLYSYEPGTTSPATTYTDASCSTANPNPVVFDAAGETPVIRRSLECDLFITTSAGNAVVRVSGVRPEDEI